MARRKDILTITLKAILAGAETSALVKIPATFIAELASLPKEKRSDLDKDIPNEQFDQLLTQAELSTANAALAAAGTEQIKKLVAKLNKLNADELNALAKLTQDKFDQTVEKLDVIDATTKETKEKVDKIAEYLKINPKIKAAVEKIFLDILEQENIEEWQWPEKLQEIAKRHRELLDKLQNIQSADPAVDELRNQARKMIELGEYGQADHFLQKAIEIDLNAINSQQEKIDQRKLSLAQSLVGQADIAETRLNYQKAIDLYQKALDTLPKDRQATRATCLNNLGLLYNTVANYEKAEPLMRQALVIDEKAFGPEHPNVATYLNNLAMLLHATNRLDEAEPMYRRVVKILEKSLGPEHPNTKIVRGNLEKCEEERRDSQ